MGINRPRAALAAALITSTTAIVALILAPGAAARPDSVGTVLGGTTTPSTYTTTKPTETTTTTKPPGGEAHCTGHAFDVRLDLTGIVSGFVGPAIKTDPDVFPDRETLSELALTVPLAGATMPVITARTLDAENSGSPAEGCTTRITYEDLVVDLNNLSSAGGLPVVLTAKAVETITTATLNADGTTSTDSHVTILGGTLSVNGGPPQGLAFEPDPNTTVIDQDFGNPALGSLRVKLVLHETVPIEGGVSANAIRLIVDLKTALPGTNQSADLKVAHAEADVHPE